MLFFKKLVVFQFFMEQAGNLSYKKVYQHQLERNGFNMCTGQFAGQKKEQICVQSCDGYLTVYD